MNINAISSYTAKPASWLLIMLILGTLYACALPAPPTSGVLEAKQRLNTLKVNNRISSMANDEFDDAQAAIIDLEHANGRDQQQFQHLLWIAQHKTELADVVSRTRYLDHQRTALQALMDDLQRDMPMREQKILNNVSH